MSAPSQQAIIDAAPSEPADAAEYWKQLYLTQSDEIKSLQTVIDKLTRKEEELDHVRTSKNDEIADLKFRLAAAEENACLLRTELEEVTETKEERETRLKEELRDVKEDLQAQTRRLSLVGSQTDLVKLQNALPPEQRDPAVGLVVTSPRLTADASVEDLAIKVVRLEEENDRLKMQRRASDMMASELQDKLEKVEEDKLLLEQELEDTQERRELAEVRLQEKLRDTQQDLAATMKKLNSPEKKEAVVAMTPKAQAMKENKAKIAQLKTELDLLKDSQRKLEQEKDDLQRKYRIYQAQSEDLQEKLQALEEDKILIQEELEEEQQAHMHDLHELKDFRNDLEVGKKLKMHRARRASFDSAELTPLSVEELAGGARKVRAQTMLSLHSTSSSQRSIPDMAQLTENPNSSGSSSEESDSD